MVFLIATDFRICKKKTTDYGPQTTDNRLRTTDYGQQTTDNRLQTKQIVDGLKTTVKHRFTLWNTVINFRKIKKT